MSLLKSVETTIASLVEGTFGRVFRSEVRPMELARKLAREMDSHRTHSVARVYVPNEYAVWLSPRDRARYEGIEQEVIDELSAYLLEHARREDLALASPPRIVFHTDERLSLGEFGIQARLVRPQERAEARVPVAVQEREQREPGGETMIYGAHPPVAAERPAPVRTAPPRALLAVGARRLIVPPLGGVIGRSRDCDIVLEDAGVSRRHAQLRNAEGQWTIEDLGSTNGVLVNGRRLRGSQPLSAGDRLELGSTEVVFELG